MVVNMMYLILIIIMLVLLYIDRHLLQKDIDDLYSCFAWFLETLKDQKKRIEELENERHSKDT